MKTEQRRIKSKATEGAARRSRGSEQRNSIVELFLIKGKYNFVKLRTSVETCIIQRTNVNKTVDGRSS